MYKRYNKENKRKYKKKQKKIKEIYIYIIYICKYIYIYIYIYIYNCSIISQFKICHIFFFNILILIRFSYLTSYFGQLVLSCISLSDKGHISLWHTCMVQHSQRCSILDWAQSHYVLTAEYVFMRVQFCFHNLDSETNFCDCCTDN